jgi:hypothetical protein
LDEEGVFHANFIEVADGGDVKGDEALVLEQGFNFCYSSTSLQFLFLLYLG